MHALIRAHPLGLLISADEEGILANPLPFLLDEAYRPYGRLRVHLSRANLQWRRIAEHPEEPVLVVFQGVDAYITPSWYATKRETGKVVPTWNYVIVQARGKARVIQDRDWLAAQINELTQTHEVGRQQPWQVSDAPEAFIEAQIKGIVGIEIDIATIEGKWKVSQNRPEADRAGVVEGLAATPEKPGASEMADLVRRYGTKAASS